MSSKKQNRRERMRRALALIMVIFLTLSVLGTAIYFLTLPVSASRVTGMTQEELMEYLEQLKKDREEEEKNSSSDKSDDEKNDSDDSGKSDADDTDEDTGKDDWDEDRDPAFDSDTEYEKADPDADDKLIRVGLMYGSNVTVGFETDAEYGFFINKVNRTGDLTHEKLFETDITKVSCTVDANLSKSAMTYSKTSDTARAVIGGYHIEIGSDLSYDEMTELIDMLEGSFSSMGIYAIPSYIDGGYRIRAGHYTTKSVADASAATLAAAYTGLEVRAASPTDTAVSLLDPVTDRILFEYDDGDITALGLTARPSPDGEDAYLVTPAKKIYDGVFMFRRYISGSIDGVSLTSVIPLGDYIKGVLPYEISSSWPLEAQKAFAICVRSFTLAGVRHESTYQVDLCNTAHCQVYGGRTRITDTVERAVDETAGLVMSYDGRIVTAYYSAVAGGVTVGVDDAWGGSAQPYLVAVQTPWEIFTNHTYGVWTAEVSPKELCSYLRNTKGYTNLSGEIVDITIDKLAKNSTYVYQLTFTDSYGNTKTVKTTDGVRTALSAYVKSSNFVVGKGAVSTESVTFATVDADDVRARTGYGVHSVNTEAPVTVITENGFAETSVSGSSVMSANGKYTLGGTSSQTERTTVYAKDPNNFIFSGKGWGHGVGLSQIGVRDLAELGYEAIPILEKYFTDIEICDWRELD